MYPFNCGKSLSKMHLIISLFILNLNPFSIMFTFSSVSTQSSNSCVFINGYLHNNEDIQIDICVELLEEDVKITIADNGQGISAYDLNNIFERYYRGEASQNTKGTGLGLAIVKEVVSTHGGKIRVKSQQGVGTTFEILLLL